MAAFPKPPVIWAPTPHFDAGRNAPIAGICFHIAEGSRQSVVNWFANPESNVSSHFLICRDGAIVQFVAEADTAWAQGVLKSPRWPLLKLHPRPNQVLLSIEHEGHWSDEWPEPMYQADLALSLHLCQTYAIKPDRPYLLGHSDLDSVDRARCPGPNFPWTRLLDDLATFSVAPVPVCLPGGRLLVGQSWGGRVQARIGGQWAPVRAWAEMLGHTVRWVPPEDGGPRVIVS